MEGWTMYDELVKRLRNKGCQICPICREAADALEEMSMRLHGDEAAIVGMKREIEYMVRAEKPHWISVTERLPEPCTEVMVAFDDGEVYALWQDWEAQDERDEPLYYMIDPFSTEAGHTVTHWMPLPPAPEPPREEAHNV